MDKYVLIKNYFQHHWLLCRGFNIPPPPPVSCTFTGPPTRLHLEEQQLKSSSHMTSKRASRWAPNQNHERVSVAFCTQHSFSLLRFRGSLSNVLGTSQRCYSTSVSPLPRSRCLPLHPFLSITLVHHPQPTPACVRASWACYPIPTVVAEFVSLTKGPALHTSERANDSNKQGPGPRGGQVARCSVELHWVLGRSTSLETQEPTICLFDVWRRFGFDGNFGKTYLEEEITYCPVVATRGCKDIQSVQVNCLRVLKGEM